MIDMVVYVNFCSAIITLALLIGILLSHISRSMFTFCLFNTCTPILPSRSTLCFILVHVSFAVSLFIGNDSIFVPVLISLSTGSTSFFILLLVFLFAGSVLSFVGFSISPARSSDFFFMGVAICLLVLFARLLIGVLAHFTGATDAIFPCFAFIEILSCSRKKLEACCALFLRWYTEIHVRLTPCIGRGVFQYRRDNKFITPALYYKPASEASLFLFRRFLYRVPAKILFQSRH